MDYSIFLNKHQYKIAFGLFIAYLCLSMYHIGVNGLWYDECFSLDLGNDSIDEIIHYSLYNDTNPPLYLIIVHFWIKIFGDSELALRSISAISGSMACGLFFLFALRFFNWQTAIFVVLLFFSSNELYYYSQEGRTYGLILLFCVLSNFAFMSLMVKPSWISAILLGVFNISIFYLHTLGCINMIGQIILAPILGFNKQLFQSKDKSTPSFLGYKLKFIIWYIGSWLVFGILFWPWKERFFGIIKDGAKGFWLQKPTINEYKQVLFDFYNSESLFYVYIILMLIVLFILLFVKKYRDGSFNYKLILIPLILGPFLFHFNFFAASITPIFLKRYVLFTFLGFILLFAYLVSSLKIDFRIKMGGLLILCLFSFSKMKVPRECYWDYKEGVKILEKRMGPTTYISTDNSMLFAYYTDRKGAFKAYQPGREQILSQKNVFQTYGTDWPNTVDFSKYTDIYFTRSFDDYNDPEKKVEKALKEKFIWTEDLYTKGLFISHYLNPILTKEVLNDLREKISDNKEWYNQVIKKASERNISVDSMLTLDAIWDYQTNILPKKNEK